MGNETFLLPLRDLFGTALGDHHGWFVWFEGVGVYFLVSLSFFYWPGD